MTTIKSQILDLMIKLPLDERRQMLEHLYDINMFDKSVIDCLSPNQRMRLDESIAQADRGAIVSSDAAFDELAGKLGFSRA